MKKKIYILLIIFIGVFLVDCTELEREDFQNIPVDQFFKTPTDVQAALTDYYSTASLGHNTGGYQNNGIMSESQTDIMEFQWDGNTGYWTNHFFLSAEQYSSWLGNILASYNEIVQGITRGTNLISNLDNIDINEDLRMRYVAEIRALRAHLALWGYYMYGGVVIMIDPDELTNPTDVDFKPRSSMEETANFIVNEIDAIKNDLPVSYSDADYGRITRGAALMIKLKVLMQEKRFSEAETTAREILTLGYSLEPVYKDLFTIEHERNPEVIWAIPCKTNVYPSSTFLSTFLPYDFPSEKPTIYKWGVWKIRWGFYDSFDEEDVRRDLIISSYTTYDGIQIKRGEGELSNGAIAHKFQEDPSMTGNLSGIDWPVFRYADALLLLAEAINENNSGPTQEAIDLINQIRARAFPDNQDKLLKIGDFVGNKEKFNDALLDERGWELYLEWTRRIDMIRHSKFIDHAMSVIPHGPISDRILLWPIPPYVVEQSKGVVQQNPGY